MPQAWPPGRYYLEATVSYSSTSGPERARYSADLHIEADQSMRLDSDTGVCRDPLPEEVQRDERQGVMTFHCGEVTFEVRPGLSTVTGHLSTSVSETYRTGFCQERAFGNPQGRCVRWVYEDRVRTVVKRERLRVAAER